ncbi:hypothetical protein M378DRAFT_163032 [Amanita muscaria Koide BX008]|uniref:Uncharacterized protein n=1 Tax=Amanita muscaria (strain Koide BX008) TaxID=946122 RepID=A0A0C2X5P0_AMAMK|nr:hypothetical protein M378DRAFT_163032 [Amanita muscaria Koide BX008]
MHAFEVSLPIHSISHINLGRLILPLYLNHIGDDLSRGLMTFDEANPLGKLGRTYSIRG